MSDYTMSFKEYWHYRVHSVLEVDDSVVFDNFVRIELENLRCTPSERAEFYRGLCALDDGLQSGDRGANTLIYGVLMAIAMKMSILLDDVDVDTRMVDTGNLEKTFLDMNR
ncbi:hypothetical protein [uncultured Methanolobus sp.]|uniref:hypothetical protein n=1 Tax=uncultured Methanolobus sp. TaxID=218300 RepID=UPI0029C8A97E|nr:hypothetical protein [uncultured Methanolobus sp.]